jgi:hypothetical protein
MRGPEGASVQQCTGATRHVIEPLAEAEGKVAGLLHGPLAGGVRGDPADVHPAGAMLDEYQHVYALQQHSIHVQEIGCDDPGGLGAQELPPARARAPRCRIDASRMQDLPHGRRRNCHAELGEFAVDPSVSPRGVLPRQADDKAGDAGACRWAPWLAPLARVVLPRRQPAVPGQQRRWRHGEDFGPAPARYKPCQRGEPGPVGWLVPDPAGVPPQDRVLMPEHQQLSILCHVTAEHQDGQAEHPARKQVDDLEQHPAS